MKLKLREVMEARGVNAAQIAEALGVTPGSVSSWLAGERRRGDKVVRIFPDLSSIEALCVLLGVTPSELLEVEATTTPTGKTLAHLGPSPKRGRPSRVTALPAGLVNAPMDDEPYSGAARAAVSAARADHRKRGGVRLDALMAEIGD